MELIQARFVTDNVAALARHYAALIGVSATVNDYYVEVASGAANVGFSRRRFTEDQQFADACARRDAVRPGDVILDFAVDDVDTEFKRIDALGVRWLFGPTTLPWGTRSMMLRDPEDHLVNICSGPGQLSPKDSK
jgi:catechol 2,3-dioxygenase-like lactoylglutathione lyase family enzyme